MFKPPFILSIAGGGSTYTPGIVKSLMVQLQDFPLAEIRLYPIDLGVDVKGADRGVPRMASRAHGAKILERLSRLSKPLGTTIEIKDGIGLIRVAGAKK